MHPREEIERFRKIYEPLSTKDLKKKLTEFVKMPDKAEYRAAYQLIEERKIQDPADRHEQILRKLDELKRPHWLKDPNFWVGVVAALAGIVAAYFGWREEPQSSGNGERMSPPTVSAHTQAHQQAPVAVSPPPQVSPVDGAPQATPPKP